MDNKQLNSKHPTGLYYLFFAEMWERFGFYLMVGIFVLYMTGTLDAGGLGMERAEASDIYGSFMAFVFLTPFIGGLLADRKLGYRLSIVLGGLMMGTGYCLLAIPGAGPAFYGGLGLVIAGNGFFKPNISAMLGNLYNEERYKHLKDSGYNIFYMGINMGAMLGPFLAAYMRINYGWGYAFATAGIGMFLGLVIFLIGSKHYKHADVRKEPQAGDQSIGHTLGITFLPALVFGVVGWILPGNIFGSDSTDAFVMATLPIIFFYGRLYFQVKEEEKPAMGAMLTIFAVVFVFWAVFKQNGTALTTWAELYTDRSMPALLEGPADAMNMVQKMPGDLESMPKLDEQFRKVLDAQGNPVMEVGPQPYLLNVPEAERPAPGGHIKLISTELFQTINPFFIILFSPLVVSLFMFLRRRNMEPSTPTKIVMGLGISALSTLVMVGAVYAGSNGLAKADALWLVSAYAVVTVGELCLSPMGLSMVSKLSPPRLTALMMGGWFLTTAIGNKLSGVLATMWDGYEHKASYFLVNCALLLVAVVVMGSMLKRLNKVFRAQEAKPVEAAAEEVE